jgi:predicted Zn-dependent peptidase
MLLEPLLPEVEIEKEKGVIVEEINMHTDDPRWHVSDVYDNVIFGSSPLGRDIIGFKQTVKDTNKKNILDFLDDWYSLNNVVLVIAGDESIVSDQESVVNKYFSKGSKRNGEGKRQHNVPDQAKPQLNIVHRATEQAHFYLGIPAIARNHPDRFNLSVLSTLLGGNSSARLFTEIREKRGLAYYAYASSSSFTDTGTLYAFEGVDPSRVEKAIKVTLEQFQAVTNQALSLQGGVNEEEVTRAKDFLTGKLILDWEDSHSLAQTYARKLLLENKIETPEEILNSIKKVNLADVVKLAKKLFDPKKLNLALIGPFKDKEKFEKLIS